jgi:hypothetical protein
VVAYPTGGIPEVLSDGETGFFVQPMEPRALAERILTLVLSQPERLEQAAAAGHRLWSERFGIERYQLEMIKVLARAMGVEPPEAPGVKEQPTGATESPSNADDRDLGGAKQFRNAAG